MSKKVGFTVQPQDHIRPNGPPDGAAYFATDFAMTIVTVSLALGFSWAVFKKLLKGD